MSPLETTQIALEFAGPAAPGWLFLLIPAAVAIAWSLYRIQFKDVGRFSRTSLFIIRCLILAGILFLIFRPVIVSRKVLTYPGRILMVIDDSESMAAVDNRLPSKDALYIARRLDPDKTSIHSQGISRNRRRFCLTASAVPWYQSILSRVCCAASI